MEKKYFFFDIDGTLEVGIPGQHQQYIPESTSLALEQLKANGHFVAIATGRGYALARPVLDKFNLPNMVSDGGNGITIDGKLVEIKPLDFDACLRLIEECNKKNYAWSISPDNTRIRYAPNDDFLTQTQDFQFMETVTVENLDPSKYDQIFKVYIACHYPEELKLETLNELPWCRYGDTYIFVEPIDKAVGIFTMMEHLGAEVKDVVVFGDGRNDLTMFREEWTSIAMGNACDELKEKATYVTDDADKDGIYNACKHFGWI